jgi:hypothetical protein
MEYAFKKPFAVASLLEGRANDRLKSLAYDTFEVDAALCVTLSCPLRYLSGLPSESFFNHLKNGPFPLMRIGCHTKKSPRITRGVLKVAIMTTQAIAGIYRTRISVPTPYLPLDSNQPLDAPPSGNSQISLQVRCSSPVFAIYCQLTERFDSVCLCVCFSRRFQDSLRPRASRLASVRKSARQIGSARSVRQTRAWASTRRGRPETGDRPRGRSCSDMDHQTRRSWEAQRTRSQVRRLPSLPSHPS